MIEFSSSTLAKMITRIRPANGLVCIRINGSEMPKP